MVIDIVVLCQLRVVVDRCRARLSEWLDGVCVCSPVSLYVSSIRLLYVAHLRTMYVRRDRDTGRRSFNKAPVLCQD
jgi:sigma54-dependent transcription regulator